MKRFLILSLFVISSCASSKKSTIVKQQYPSPFEFTLVDTLAGTKEELYIKAYEWVSRTYGSAKAVIDMQDKGAGKIIGKAIIDLDGLKSLSGKVKYLIAIDTKDGKYRCTISSFDHSGHVSYTRYGPITSRSYGDLSKEKFLYKSPNYNKMVEDKRFYLLKNYVFLESKATLESLKTKMHDHSDTF